LIGDITRVQYVQVPSDPQDYNSYSYNKFWFCQGVCTVVNHNVATVSACSKAI